ncbi:uncharacterized protein MONBRDRAFT_30346 [Monosiga brevicollis MX1]|uniref:Uncharacterized protein n=1 Tax=Monosiga brevicollis TaxID=81824 RepID=A9VDQ2_MONBE|nr:uncharacterized protein MONBRDRAFT_30346 [Monosiga brevicollis MX1]EDQ84341.1 predicted protein [Monosiga brevicollis MX1]|eukprot:XP_001750837.1 hypothetical protein [Monosiga brevicollis MX1]
MAATGTVNAYSNRHRQINLDRLRQAAVEQRQESQEDDRRRARLRHEAKERLRRLQAKREASQQATEHKRQAQLAARRQEIQDTNHAYLHHNAARRHTSVGDQHQSHPHDTADGSDHDWAQARSYHHPPPVHRAPSPSLQGPFPQRRVPGAAVEKNMARDDAHRDAVLSDAYSLLAQFRQHPPDAGPPPPEGPYSYPAGLAVFRGPSEEDIQRVWNSIRDMTHQNRPAYTNHDHLSRPSQSRGSHRRHHFSREAPATYAANAHPYPSSQASNDSPPQPGQYYGKLHTRSSSQGAVAPPPQGPPPRHERPSLRTHQDPRHAESHSNMAHAQNKAWSRPAAQPYNHYQNSGDADSIEGAHAPHPAAHAPHLARTYSNSSLPAGLSRLQSPLACNAAPQVRPPR